jgi:hypothetical protein
LRLEDTRPTGRNYRFCRLVEVREYEKCNELFVMVGRSVKMHLQEDEKRTEKGVDNVQ